LAAKLYVTHLDDDESARSKEKNRHLAPAVANSVSDRRSPACTRTEHRKIDERANVVLWTRREPKDLRTAPDKQTSGNLQAAGENPRPGSFTHD